MDRVNFLTIELEEDLILSFSFDDNTTYGVDGYFIHRAPQFEYIVAPHERGPTVDWSDDDKIILVRKVEFDRNVVKITADNGNEIFDISKISDTEFVNMIKVLDKMNFDGAFEIINNSGVE